MIANVATSTDFTDTPELSCEDVSSFSNDFSASVRTTDESLRNERIEKYLPLVQRVLGQVMRKLPPHVDADDLYSAGVTGLIAAVDRFEVAQEAKFAAYACLRIRGAMLDELRRIDPFSRRTRVRAKKIQAATQEVEQALGRTPTAEELSARLQIPVNELERWRDATMPIRIVSLDAPGDLDEPSSGSLHEVIADDDRECTREKMEKEELIELLSSRIATLPDLEKKTLALYYFEGMSFVEIAQAFNLSQSRICQIHKKAVSRLKTYLRSR